MPVSEKAVRDVAAAISHARGRRECIEAPFAGHVLDEEAAYAALALVVANRLAGGEHLVGWKLGYTSAVMRAQMGVSQPNFGPLTDAMLLADGAVVPESVIQPRVEPEIALVIATDVEGPASPYEITAHVASARAALEVVDSVWCGYRFTWADNTADGSSAAFVVLGPELSLSDLSDMAAALERNGESVGQGRASDTMGSPMAALAWLSARLQERGERLRGGQVVITGGLTRAVPLDPGDVVTATIGGERVTVSRQPSVGNGPTSDDILVR
jgi:2-keto-4-pentenoate hydratase